MYGSFSVVDEFHVPESFRKTVPRPRFLYSGICLYCCGQREILFCNNIINVFLCMFFIILYLEMEAVKEERQNLFSLF